MVRSIVRWVGSKQRVLQQLLPLIPATFGSYYEPFLGSASFLLNTPLVQFRAQHPDAMRPTIHGADANRELINCYEQVIQDWRAVAEATRRIADSEDAYYAVRALDRDPAWAEASPLERAARFMYLNRTAFQGLWRVNVRTGYHNTPYGGKQRPLDDARFEVFSQLMRNVELACCDFEEHLDACVSGDFTYIDPPYVPAPGVSTFTAYVRGGFSQDDHERLRRCCVDLDRRGVMFMQSNSDCAEVRSLYVGYRIDTIDVRRSVAASASARGIAKEVVIRNY